MKINVLAACLATTTLFCAEQEQERPRSATPTAAEERPDTPFTQALKDTLAFHSASKKINDLTEQLTQLSEDQKQEKERLEMDLKEATAQRKKAAEREKSFTLKIDFEAGNGFDASYEQRPRTPDLIRMFTALQKMSMSNDQSSSDRPTEFRPRPSECNPQ